MYDGSDAYDSIDDAIEYLPKIYDNQIKAIIKVLKNYQRTTEKVRTSKNK